MARVITITTGGIMIITSVIMIVAAAAQDLQVYSGGRFRLGVGSQIKPHITRRFGMP